jgi:hypothetical protein
MLVRTLTENITKDPRTTSHHLGYLNYDYSRGVVTASGGGFFGTWIRTFLTVQDVDGHLFIQSFQQITKQCYLSRNHPDSFLFITKKGMI